MPHAAAAPTRRVVILIGLFLALVVPCLGLFRRMIPFLGAPTPLGQEGFWWTLVALVLLYMLVIERRGFSSIGLRRPTWRTLAFGVGGAIAAYAAGGAAVVLVLPALGLHQDAGAFQRMLDTPFWLRVAIVTRAAVCEEIFFRGYGIERLEELTGSKLAAGAISLAAFSFAHLNNWGPAQILVAGSIGLVLTVLYIWRRDLAANMLTHWIVDALGVLVSR